jgi:4-diphosphocytidyl-2-C-methyl-D-erythritol kinase
MHAEGHAKVNFSLLVDAPDATGMHPIRSVVQSIAWSDCIYLEAAEEDRFDLDGPGPAGEENLAWRAAMAVRSEAESRQPLSLRLEKRVAVAAGLGGGSADAAASLTLAAAVIGADPALPERLAADLGADVRFCLAGGLARVSGFGEQIESLAPAAGFSVGIVVPHFELVTADVYRNWDRLEGPTGDELPGRGVPPGLRDLGPFRNDLWPASAALRPELGDLRADLTALWARPVAMSGSGPALFAFFLDEEEAAAAVTEVGETRSAVAASPVSRGVSVGNGTLAARP